MAEALGKTQRWRGSGERNLNLMLQALGARAGTSKAPDFC
jgi:hypothetical protein